MTKRLTVFLLAVFLICASFFTSCQIKEGSGGEQDDTSRSVDIYFMVDNEVYARLSQGGVPEDPEKQGFRFDGWFLDKGTWENEMEFSVSNRFPNYTLSPEVESALGGIDGLETYVVQGSVGNMIVGNSSIMYSIEGDEDIYVWAKFVEIPRSGYNPGEQCYTRDIELFGDGEGTETFNIETAGKVTVLNFWGTWCSPCKSELPHFNELAIEYGDRITMVAIHSNQGLADASAYIAAHFADSPILFGHDDAQDSYFKMLGGYAYPLTVVVDEYGVVVANHTGTLSKDALKALIDTALGDVTPSAE